MMEVVFGRIPDRFGRSARWVALHVCRDINVESVHSRHKPEWFKGARLDFPKADTPRQSRKYVKGMKPLDVSEGEICSIRTDFDLVLQDIVSPTSIVNSRFLDLLTKLLTWDPHQRITVKEALRHPYFALKIADEGSFVDGAS